MEKCDGRCGIYNTNLSCIYMIMQISTGAKYIGETLDFWRRYKQYRKNNTSTRPIVRAIQYYGWEDFIMIPIEVFNFDIYFFIFSDDGRDIDYLEYKDILKERESYWKDYYNVNNDSFHFNNEQKNNSIKCVGDKCIYNNNCQHKYTSPWRKNNNRIFCGKGEYTSKKRLHFDSFVTSDHKEVIIKKYR